MAGSLTDIRGRAGWTAAMLVLVGLSACRPAVPPRIAPRPPLGREALLEALRTWPVPPALEGRAYLRLTAGEQGLPGLNARFVVHGPGGANVMLRPGVLPPVLSMWVGPSSWRLLLPRQRVYAQATDSRAEADLPADMLGDLFEYLLTPQLIVAGMQDIGFVPHQGDVILRGTLESIGGKASRAEIAVDPRSLAVSRWSLSDDRGASLVRVAYEPPILGSEYTGNIVFLVPQLDVRGVLEVRDLERSDRDPAPPPEVPESWERIHPEEVILLLEGVSGDTPEEP
ncbi:MAG: hypothetical protein V1774_10220 [Candidatus Eisenbacteria bacterium]